MAVYFDNANGNVVPGSGGAGSDVLEGGDGTDRFDFNALIDSGTAANTRDAINGFAHLGDLIDVASIDASAGLAGNNAFSFIGSNGFAAEGPIRAARVPFIRCQRPVTLTTHGPARRPSLTTVHCGALSFDIRTRGT